MARVICSGLAPSCSQITRVTSSATAAVVREVVMSGPFCKSGRSAYRGGARRKRHLQQARSSPFLSRARAGLANQAVEVIAGDVLAGEDHADRRLQLGAVFL